MLHPSRKYYIIIGSQTTLLSNFPEGWKESNEETTYNESTGTLLRTYKSQSLTFYREGAELLKGVFEADGFDGVAELRIEERQSDYSFALKFQGLFEFQTYSYDAVKESVTINIADNGDQVRYANRKDLKIRANKTTSIDGDSISSTPVRDVRLMPQNLVKQSETKIKDSVSVDLNKLSEKQVKLSTAQYGHVISGSSIILPSERVSSVDFAVFNLNGYSDIFGAFTPASFLTQRSEIGLDSIVEFKRIYLYFSGLSFSVLTDEFNVDISLLLRNEDGTLADTINICNDIIAATDTTYLLDVSDFVIKVKKDQYIEFDGSVSRNGSGTMTIGFANQIIDVKESSSSISNRDTAETYEFTPIVDAVVVNEMYDELTMPEKSEGFAKLLKNNDKYTKKINIKTDAQAVNINVSGIASQAFLFNINSNIRVYDISNNELYSFNLYDINISALASYLETTTAINTEIDLPAGGYLQIETIISFTVQGIGLDSIIKTIIEGNSYTLVMDEIPPPANDVQGHLWHDVLSHCMDAIVGTNKLYIEPSLIDSTNKLNLNSAYNLMLMRGSMLRGFTASELPLSCSFDELLQDIRKLFCVGMYYDNSNERFVVDYMTNIYKNDVPTTYDLGLIDDVVIGVQEEEVYKSIVVGNEQESGIEDFYVRNEGHNKTTYTLPVVNAETELNLATSISTDATDIELTRRYRKADTENISRNNDNKLYFVKCYTIDTGVYVMEQEQRLTVNNSPTYFANANLCLLPRIVIENNGAIIKPTLYKKATGALIQFQTSKYIIPAADKIEIYDEETTNDYSEQSDVFQQVIAENPLWLPEKIGFSHYVNADIMSQIFQNPHRVWKGTDRNGNVYKVFARQIGLDKTNRESEWEMIRIFE